MKYEPSNHALLSNADLLIELRRLTSCEREVTVRLIEVLGEVDARRLFLAEGCSSLFTYCTQVLHMSEHAAYGRIEAARAARRWPILLELLADGSLHLTAVTLLSRHLTTENHQELFTAARHKSKRQIEEIVATLRPQPAVPATVRKVPAPRPSSEEGYMLKSAGAAAPTAGPLSVLESPGRLPVPPTRPSDVKPLAPERYKLQCTISRETYGKLREALDLLRHRSSEGDMATIVDRALTLLLRELHNTKHSAVDRPHAEVRKGSHGRHIPATVKRAVWERDEGQCAFIGGAGRCTERGFLEYHHVVPFADGGATTAENLQLRCHAHNQYEAHLWDGMWVEEIPSAPA
jgi:5-methylcytosine-specific restriction endonuclease McrA